jgi:hypothetical protein
MSGEFSESGGINIVQRKFVRNIIHPKVRNLSVKKYRIGLQTYTFIRLYINDVKQIIYIQNLEKEFFSSENVYSIDYIKNLKIECIVDDSIEENEKITFRSHTIQTKYIGYY